MDFTREPIIETVITPRDGHRIVVRSSKNPGQEEFFVDALEVVTFGQSCFFRSRERPRAFIVPSTDYEVLEVREPRLPLKTPSIDGIVKIGSAHQTRPDISRSAAPSAPASAAHTSKERYHGTSDERRDVKADVLQKEPGIDRREPNIPLEKKEHPGGSSVQTVREPLQGTGQESASQLQRDESHANEGDSKANSSAVDRRRDRRRNLRRRRGAGRSELKQDEVAGNEAEMPGLDDSENMAHDLPDGSQERENQERSSRYEARDTLPPPVQPQQGKERGNRRNERGTVAGEESGNPLSPSTLITSILPPPTTLIRDDLARLRNNELYKGAFYMRDQDSQESSSSTAQSSESHEDNAQDDDDFLITSSLRFDDDDDEMNSNAYKATPVNNRGGGLSKKRESDLSNRSSKNEQGSDVQTSSAARNDRQRNELEERVNPEDSVEKSAVERELESDSVNSSEKNLQAVFEANSDRQSE